MLLIRLQPIHPVSHEDAMHGGDCDRELVETVQIRGDATGTKVVVLTQIQDLADLGSRRSWGAGVSRPVAEPRVTVLGVSSFPPVERLAGNTEATAHPRDIPHLCTIRGTSRYLATSPRSSAYVRIIRCARLVA
jgi:hypothetical protein